MGILLFDRRTAYSTVLFFHFSDLTFGGGVISKTCCSRSLTCLDCIKKLSFANTFQRFYFPFNVEHLVKQLLLGRPRMALAVPPWFTVQPSSTSSQVNTNACLHSSAYLQWLYGVSNLEHAGLHSSVTIENGTRIEHVR